MNIEDAFITLAYVLGIFFLAKAVYYFSVIIEYVMRQFRSVKWY